MRTINIYLIGMMGSGKSTIGRKLADRLNMSWIDMDEAIENKGMKIPEIFEKYGETRFREIETEVTSEISKLHNYVVSTGGGVILRSDNISIMKESGHSIYLNASTETLLRNLEMGREHRPLIKEGSLKEKIETLLNVRGDRYITSADFNVKTDGLDPDALVDKIINLLNL